MSIDQLVIDGLAQDCAKLEEQYVDALVEIETYREMLSVAMELLEVQTKRADATTQRLRQVMGFEPWHREEDPAYSVSEPDDR